MAENDAKSIDKGTLELLEKAAADGVNTAFDRAEAMKPCPIGAVGSCCKHCGMGPCRVPLAKGKEETPDRKDVVCAELPLKQSRLVTSSGW